MEKFIIRLFSEQLETYIHGFRKEQLNANLLNGKGEISDVQVKVEPINEILRQYTSLIELSSVYLSKMNINVTSFRQIKKAPIEISIDEVHIVLVEPLLYPFAGQDHKSWMEQSTAVVEKAKKSGPYGLLERIVDNITLNINRVYLTFQPMGTFKTRRVGKWTPPAISIVFNYLRYVSVDEFGNEGSPDAVWRHNTRTGRQEARFRQQQQQQQNTNGNFSVGIGGIGSSGGRVPGAVSNENAFRHRTFMIYKKVTMEVSIAIGNRSDGMPAKESFLSGNLLFANLPLQSHLCIHRRIRDNAILAVQVDTSLMNLEFELDADILPMLLHMLVGVESCIQKKESFVDPFGKVGEDSNAELLNMHVTYDADKNGITGANGSMDIPEDESFSDELSVEEASEMNARAKNSDEEKWPILVMPAGGLVIHEKIAFSLSIHHIGMRVRYDEHAEGFLQVTMKGFVAEVIWPREGNAGHSLGGCIQMSLAYINVQDTYKHITRQIMHGGHHYGKNDNGEANETTAEEMFPMFETSVIRSDPADLRSTFPVQVFGWKATIDVLGEDKILSFTSKLSILQEVGVNDVDITILPEAMMRLLSFFEKGQSAIDERWFTGIWSAETDINDFQKYVHIIRFDDDPVFMALSPEQMNITARLCGCKIHVPPKSPSDLRCGSFSMSLSEAMIIISPSLPRQFLQEDIPVTKNKSCVSAGQYPNHTKDISYEHNSDLTPYARAQITVTGFSIIFRPSSPCFNAHKSKQLLDVSKVIMLASYEILKVEKNDDSAHFFLSTMIQNANSNIDFDVISSLLATFKIHEEAIPKQLKYRLLSTGINIEPPDLLNVTMRTSISELNVSVWKQHLRVAAHDGKMQSTNLPVALLLRWNVSDVELGTDVFCKDTKHDLFPFCIKGSIGSVQLLTGSFGQSTDIDAEGNGETISPSEIVIFSFGLVSQSQNESNQSILFRMERWLESGCFQAGAVVSSGQIIVNENLDRTVSLIVESVLNFDWSIFPSLLSSPSAWQASDSIDWRLRLLAIPLRVNPNLISFLHVKIQLENVSLRIPYKNSNKQLLLVGENAAFFSGYSHDGHIPAMHKERWEAAYRDDAQGFHHVLSSRQKCLISEKTNIKTMDEVVNTFAFSVYFHPSDLKGSLDQCSLSLKEWAVWDELYHSLLEYYDKFLILYVELTTSIAELRDKTLDKSDPPHEVSIIHKNENSPLSLICTASSNEIKSARELLGGIKETLLSHTGLFQDSSQSSAEQFKKLRERLFQTERERMSAFSLVSHQMSGFIQMSAADVSGSRFGSGTSFWQYFGVINESRFVIFKDTSKTKPVHLLSLARAKIRTISGAGAKRTFNRAFAIVEADGKMTSFIAPSYSEYEQWIAVLKRATNANVDTTAPQTEPDGELNASVLETNVEPDAPEVITTNNFDARPTIASFDDISLDMQGSDSKDSATDDIDLTPSLSGDAIIAVDDNLSQSSFFEQPLPAAGKRGAKFREKMAKIKTSVKNNVKTMNDNVKNIKMDKTGKTPVFTRRQRSSNANTDLPSMAALKIKEVRVNNEEPPTKTLIELEKNQKLHSLPGVWKCEVMLDIVSQIDEGITNKSSPIKEMVIPPSFEEKRPELLLDINLSCKTLNSVNELSSTQVRKSLPEMLVFHSNISANLVAIQQNPSAADLDILLSENGKDFFAQVVYSGKVLQGLVPLLQNGRPRDCSYVGTVVSSFIDALFSNPMPTSVFTSTLNFFDLHSFNSIDRALEMPVIPSDFDTEVETRKDVFPARRITEKLFNLIHSCEAAVARTERQIARTKLFTSQEANKIKSNGIAKEDVHSNVSNISNTVMQDALESVMLERDEAHSALVASRVFHAHEIDQQKRKIDLLESRLKSIEATSDKQSAPGAAFFLGQETIPDINTLARVEQEMIQNVDVELLELCRQLSSSISSRVAAELEIVRLNESRKIEQLAQTAERERIELELKQLKEQASAESLRRKAAEENAQKWKKSFEALLLQSDSPLSNTK